MRDWQTSKGLARRLLRSRSEDIHMAMFVFSVIINVLILYATFPDDEIGPDGLPGAGYWNVLFRPVWVGWCVFGLGMVMVQLTIATTVTSQHNSPQNGAK